MAVSHLKIYKNTFIKRPFIGPERIIFTKKCVFLKHFLMVKNTAHEHNFSFPLEIIRKILKIYLFRDLNQK